MAFDANVVRQPGVVSGADFSTTGKNLFGVIGAGQVVTVNTSSGGRVSGVILDDPIEGVSVEFAVFGTVPVIAGAAIADGALIESDNEGRAITQTSTNFVAGVAVGGGAAAAGDLVTVLLTLQH